jgi:hypothetical protein
MNAVTGQSMVVHDDTSIMGGRWPGKRTLGVPWMIGRGWKPVLAGDQTILIRPKGSPTGEQAAMQGAEGRCGGAIKAGQRAVKLGHLCDQNRRSRVG